MIIHKKKLPKSIKLQKDLRPTKMEFLAKITDVCTYRLGFLFQFEMVSGPLRGTQFTKEFQRYGDLYRKLLDAVDFDRDTYDEEGNYLTVREKEKLLNKIILLEFKPVNVKAVDNFQVFKRMRKSHVRLAKRKT